MDAASNDKSFRMVYYLSHFKLTEGLWTVAARIAAGELWLIGLTDSALPFCSGEETLNLTGPRDPNSSFPSKWCTKPLPCEIPLMGEREDWGTSNKASLPRSFPLKTGECGCEGGSLFPSSSKFLSCCASNRPLLRDLDSWFGDIWFFDLPGDCLSLYEREFYKTQETKKSLKTSNNLWTNKCVCVCGSFSMLLAYRSHCPITNPYPESTNTSESCKPELRL